MDAPSYETCTLPIYLMNSAPNLAVPGAHTKLERGSWGTSRWVQIIAHWHIHFEWTTILPGMALLIPSSIPER